MSLLQRRCMFAGIEYKVGLGPAYDIATGTFIDRAIIHINGKPVTDFEPGLIAKLIKRFETYDKQSS